MSKELYHTVFEPDMESLNRMVGPNSKISATPCMDVLRQLAGGPVIDGDLASKDDRDVLVKARYADRVAGWNFLTREGVLICHTLRIIRS